ncbi:hypothetical protein [Leptospira ognonensis]|uniref:hypothetical protein n=1 Tax=Leptospira ognonensis TaxID=2484945 RepID=UPI001083C7AE|nr:hypothetical protein [Leptospira ognonensis]
MSGFYFLPKSLLEFFFFNLCFISLWNAYIIFLINLQNSISFRILRDIYDLDLKSANYNTIDQFYPDSLSLNDRLGDMVKNRFIRNEKDQVLITKKGIFFAKSFLFFRRMFGIRTFG